MRIICVIIKKINDTGEFMKNLKIECFPEESSLGKTPVPQYRSLQKGQHYPLHWHDEFELEIITHGSMEHIHNNKRDILTEGCAYLMSYYDLHSATAITDVSLIHLRFDKSIINPKLSEYLISNPMMISCKLPQEECSDIEGKIKELCRIKKTPGRLDSILTESLLNEIVIKILRNSSAEANTEMPKPVLDVIAYINISFSENISLASAAAKLSFSPNYLGSLIKQYTGVTFSEYLNTVRLKFACSLLISTDLQIKEIAFIAGYNSVEYFLYSFKKKLRTTPRQFRAENI